MLSEKDIRELIDSVLAEIALSIGGLHALGGLDEKAISDLVVILRGTRRSAYTALRDAIKSMAYLDRVEATLEHAHNLKPNPELQTFLGDLGKASPPELSPGAASQRPRPSKARIGS